MQDQTPKLITQDEFNLNVSRWAITTKSRMVSSAPASAGKREKPEGEEHLKTSVRFSKKKVFGDISAVGFGFARHGIYRSYGAGRGQGGTKGGTWENRHGMKISTNSASLGKMNTGKRRALDWFDVHVKHGIKQLADIAQEYYGDKAMRDLLSKIDRYTITKK